MLKVTFLSAGGAASTVEAKAGESAMQAAIMHGVAGIIAECGGVMSCATCHVYVDAAWQGRLPTANAEEDDMLGFTVAERRPTSRLACQLTLADEHDGLILHLPATQV